jgi:hypothetical protein
LRRSIAIFSVEGSVERADKALDQAKAAGRARCLAWNVSMAAGSAERY